MNCNNNCTTCESSCLVLCPVCGIKGMKVNYKTVSKLLKDNTHLFKEDVYLCTNKKCNIAYYQVDNPNTFNKEEVKVPIWFKEKYDKYLVCYCHNIYLSDIVKYVLECNTVDKITIDEIKNKFPKVYESCDICNPTGVSCEKLFNNSIDFAYKQKEEDK